MVLRFLYRVAQARASSSSSDALTTRQLVVTRNPVLLREIQKSFNAVASVLGACAVVADDGVVPGSRGPVRVLYEWGTPLPREASMPPNLSPAAVAASAGAGPLFLSLEGLKTALDATLPGPSLLQPPKQAGSGGRGGGGKGRGGLLAAADTELGTLTSLPEVGEAGGRTASSSSESATATTSRALGATVVTFDIFRPWFIRTIANNRASLRVQEVGLSAAAVWHEIKVRGGGVAAHFSPACMFHDN